MLFNDRQWAMRFYKSKPWKECRESYISHMPLHLLGYCERCYELHHEYTLGDEVHHKIHLTKDNIKDASISLNHDNLILVCVACHNQLHERFKKKDKRYSFDKNGSLKPK